MICPDSNQPTIVIVANLKCSFNHLSTVNNFCLACSRMFEDFFALSSENYARQNIMELLSSFF